MVGIDEVGRGPLAGPITLASICLPDNFQFSIFNFLIKDSKKLSKERRNEVFKICQKLKKEGKIYYAVSSIRHSSIDKYGLAKCIKKGIERCLNKMQSTPTWVGVDCALSQALILLDGGLKAPAKYKDQKTIIKGDEKVKIIALASIIAKVSRDRHMRRLAKKFPEYGFEIHKGYGTKLHLDMIKKYGPCEIHRKTFCRGVVKPDLGRV